MKYIITTLGCKVNQYETQAMEAMLRERGLTEAEPGQADVVIVNTCAVTAESGRKSRQAVRRLESENPGALVAVCGCFSQISPEDTKALGADIVYGSGDRKKLVDDIVRALGEREEIVCVDDPFKRRVFEPLPAGAVAGRTRAMLKIQDGCDNFCTYCVIPYARGRVRSLPSEQAAAEAAKMQAEGFKELVITGIEVASYGKDLKNGEKLGDAVLRIGQAAPGLRLRLGSLEPTVVTEDFCDKLLRAGNVCRHFHLSLQSGCSSVLKRMNRKYDADRFYEAVCLLREKFPGCGLTADLITGFPGETLEEHAATLEFIRKCAFSAMHIFPYSVRPGTVAAKMEGQLTKEEKARRAHEAQKVADEMQREFLLSSVGQVLPVLFETQPEPSLWQGHSDNYLLVECEGENLRGIVTNVQITGVDGEKLVGKAV